MVVLKNWPYNLSVVFTLRLYILKKVDTLFRVG
jgi:hypothetical protein